jgi:hypothetical protein
MPVRSKPSMPKLATPPSEPPSGRLARHSKQPLPSTRPKSKPLCGMVPCPLLNAKPASMTATSGRVGTLPRWVACCTRPAWTSREGRTSKRQPMQGTHPSMAPTASSKVLVNGWSGSAGQAARMARCDPRRGQAVAPSKQLQPSVGTQQRRYSPDAVEGVSPVKQRLI